MQKATADRHLSGTLRSQTLEPAQRRHRTRLAHYLVRDPRTRRANLR